MALLLPFFFLSCLVYFYYRVKAQSLRVSVLQATLITAVLVVVGVELLSLPRLLERRYLAGFWSIALLAAISLVYATRRRGVRLPRPRAVTTFQHREILVVSRPLLPAAALLAGTALLVAFLSPPNMIDSQIYHMPRVLFWLQERSVAHFPTSSYQQLFQPPWTEFATLHLYALWGNDRVSNLVPYLSFLCCALLASLIAQNLGSSPVGQVTAAVFVLTLPQGLLAAPSLKNDWPATLWVCTVVYFILRYDSKPSSWTAVKLGMATGLALLTKGTAYVYVPAVLLAAAPVMRSANCRRLAKSAVIILLVASGLNAGHFCRNWLVFRSPFGCDSAECGTERKVFPFANSSFGPKTVLANSIRNTVLHLVTPIPRLNALVYEVSLRGLRAAGIDPNDPASTWSFARFERPSFSLNEASAGNPLHLILYIIAVPALIKAWPPGRKAFLGLAVAPVVGFIAFCWVFRWQPWHTRLHLPLFGLMAAWVGWGAGRFLKPWAARAGCILLLIQAVPFAIANDLRPLLGPGRLIGGSILELPRRALYRAPDGTEMLVHALRSQPCKTVGLEAPGHYSFYPLLEWLGIARGSINVTVLSTDPRLAPLYRNERLRPCAVIITNCSDSPQRQAECASLGPSVAYGAHRLFLSFDADWVPAKGWENRARMPRVLSLFPTVAGPGRQELALTVRDPDGADTISVVLLVINTFIGAEDGCFLQYNKDGATFWMLSDDGRKWLGPLTGGLSGAIRNSRCVLHSQNTKVIRDGELLTIQWDLTVNPGWDTRRAVFAHVSDTTGLNSSWLEVGEWMPTPPRSVSSRE